MKLNSDVTKAVSQKPGNAGEKEGATFRKTSAESNAFRKTPSSAVQFESASLQKTQRALDDVPVVDQARVKELKDRIQRGEYTVESGKIAEAMLREAAMERHFG